MEQDASVIKPGDLIFTFGRNCKDANDFLERVSMYEVYEKIVQKSSDLEDLTKNLRAVLRYSKERYRSMKTSLPYFSCSVFNPAFRGIKNFEGASGLILDIDYQAPVPEDLINRMKTDPRVALGYISPSDMGLKLVFLFDKVIRDAEVYTQVYKHFSHEFAQLYHIADKLDGRNSDVSRISFLNHDANAWMHPDPIPLDWESVYNHTVREMIPIPVQDVNSDNISPSVYKQILQKLDTRPKPVKVKIPVHRDVMEVLPSIEEELKGYGIEIKESEGIQFGAKIRFFRGKDQGELNIYAGKRGFTVVTSPRKGTHPELNEIARHVVESVLIKY